MGVPLSLLAWAAMGQHEPVEGQGGTVVGRDRASLHSDGHCAALLPGSGRPIGPFWSVQG